MPEPIQSLSYSDGKGELEPSTRNLLRIAIISGTFPLVAGCLILNCFLMTHADWLIGVGLFTIGFGLVAFFVGSIALLGYQQEMKAAGTMGRREWAHFLAVAVLLLSNFPAAFACILIAANGNWPI